MEKKEKINFKKIIGRAESFFEENTKILLYVVAGVTLVVVGYFGVKKFYIEPREVEASDLLFGAENRFGESNYELALKGDTKFIGLVDFIDQYGSTKPGNLAKYYAGVSCLHLGRFDEAVEYLRAYKAEDIYTSIMSMVALGDAYLEKGNVSDAISSYKEASSIHANELATPYALFKLGMLYFSEKNFEKAAQAFKSIKFEYARSMEARDIDKYISLAEGSEQK